MNVQYCNSHKYTTAQNSLTMNVIQIEEFHFFCVTNSKKTGVFKFRIMLNKLGKQINCCSASRCINVKFIKIAQVFRFYF